MRNVKIFFIYLKRRLKSPVFMLAAVLIPLAAIGASSIDTDKARGLEAGVYSVGNDELVSALIKNEGAVTFTVFDSEQTLTRAVENESINCGYIINDNFFDALVDNKSGAIVCLKAPSSILTSIANEALIKTAADVYCADIAADYMDSSDISYDRDKLESAFRSYLEDGSAIDIDYSFTDGSGAEQDGRDSTANNILSGLAAVYVMLGGILGINAWLADEKRSIPFGEMNVICSVLIMSVFAFVAFCISGELTKELAIRQVLYFALVSGYCVLLKKICYTEELLCGALPMLVLGSLIACPIFADFSAFIPIVGVIGYMFAPFYYLSSVSTLAIGAAAFCTVAFIVDKVHR